MDLDTQIPEGWRPSEGDKIVGKVIDITQGWSDYTQDNYPIVVIHDEDKDQDISVHCFHYVLNKEMHRLKPQIGETIGIKKGPDVPTKDNKRTVATYVVKVAGRTTTDVWDAKPAPKQVEQAISSVEIDDDLPI